MDTQKTGSRWTHQSICCKWNQHKNNSEWVWRKSNALLSLPIFPRVVVSCRESSLTSASWQLDERTLILSKNRVTEEEIRNSILFALGERSLLKIHTRLIQNFPSRLPLFSHFTFSSVPPHNFSHHQNSSAQALFSSTHTMDLFSFSFHHHHHDCKAPKSPSKSVPRTPLCVYLHEAVNYSIMHSAKGKQLAQFRQLHGRKTWPFTTSSSSWQLQREGSAPVSLQANHVHITS